MIRQFANNLLIRMQQQADGIAIETGYGVCGNWDFYKERVGVVKGLKEAMAIVENTANKLEHDDEDEVK
jgi:hypothetical protein